MTDLDDKDGFTWEGAYEKTWESIREDESGSIRQSVLDAIHEAKRKRLLARQKNVRLGIMRHVFLILDMSECMLDKDYQPTRIQYTIQMLRSFIDEFFDQNPISQLGILVTRDKKAEMVLGLTGNARAHEAALNKMLDMGCSGETSLQNAVSMAHHVLRHTPSHSSREILYVVGSLSTCDPGNVASTIEKLIADKVACSAIALAAEVHVLKEMTDKTRGTHSVVMDEIHFKELLFGFTLPPTSARSADSSMVRMGFPTHRQSGDMPSFCACHDESEGSTSELSTTGYYCPQCSSKYCSLPVQCRVCSSVFCSFSLFNENTILIWCISVPRWLQLMEKSNPKLTLVSAPQLARSYQHLTPLESFRETTIAASSTSSSDSQQQLRCFACDRVLELKSYDCTTCRSRYCIDCDLLLHESMHLCPGCS